MAKESEKKAVKRWRERIDQAEKAYNAWAKDYKIARCKRYWKGHQRVGEDRLDAHDEERAVVNLIKPSVGVQIPSMYFNHPFVRISASPAISETADSTLDEKKQLLQDTANTIVRDKRTDFKFQTRLAMKDAFWAFGVVETGYSAVFSDNPAFKRPPLYEDEKAKEDLGSSTAKLAPEDEPADLDEVADDISSLEKLVSEEHFYVKRIPPQTFRCSVNSNPTLEHNDWVGYYEWMYVEDVKKAPAYRRTSSLKSSGKLANEYSSLTKTTTTPDDLDAVEDEDSDRHERSGMVKIWKVWSLRDNTRYVLADGHDYFLLKKKYRVMLLHVLRLEEDPDEFYPIPPIYSMLFPQDEYNDSREMLRGLRKTVYPRHLVSDRLKTEEREKLEMGGPNVYAVVEGDPTGVVVPLQQPLVDSAVVRTLAVAKEDLLQVSHVSGESRGQAESDTATQAAIVDRRQTITESFARMLVAEWLGSAIKALMNLAIDKMTLPMWVKRNVDLHSPSAPMDAEKIAELHREITLDDLMEADRTLRWDVAVDIETMSPVTEQEARAEMSQLITMISQPAAAMLLAKAPTLLKRALDTFGFRSSADHKMVQEALGLVAAANMQVPGSMPNPSQAQQPGPGGPQFAAAPAGPGAPTPDQAQPQPGPIVQPAAAPPQQ